MQWFQAVQLEFIFFITEECCDFVYIRDGPDLNDPLLAIQSGDLTNYLPLGPYWTSQSYMHVQFRTDGSIVYAGFEAHYSSGKHAYHNLLHKARKWSIFVKIKNKRLR